MSKALEIFESMATATFCNYDEMNWCEFSMKDRFEEKDIDLVRKALSPPSEEEVCNELSEFLQGTNINASVEVTFENNNFMYFHTIVVQDIGGHLRFDFPVALPPRLISLICRFYEGRGEAR